MKKKKGEIKVALSFSFLGFLGFFLEAAYRLRALPLPGCAGRSQALQAGEGNTPATASCIGCFSVACVSAAFPDSFMKHCLKSM